jgi:hypothetical protein
MRDEDRLALECKVIGHRWGLFRCFRCGEEAPLTKEIRQRYEQMETLHVPQLPSAYLYGVDLAQVEQRILAYAIQKEPFTPLHNPTIKDVLARKKEQQCKPYPTKKKRDLPPRS